MAENLNEFRKQISDLKKQMNEMLKKAGEDTLARANIKAKPEYKALIVQLKEINSQILEVKKRTEDYVDSLISQQSKAKELKGIYSQLGNLDLERIKKQSQNLNMDADKVKQFEKISDLNKQLAQLSAEDSISRQLIQKEIESELKDLEGSRGIHSHIVKNLKKQYEFANNISNLTEGQKEQLEAQVKTYESIKKSISGIFDTLSILTSGGAGTLGSILIGAGFAADKLGKNIRSFGGFVDSAQLSTLGLSFLFKDAEETAKGLSKEFGGLKDITLQTQLNTNLIATNMGISGEEAASVVGSFARLNNNSADAAVNMAATTKSMAKAAGLPVDQLMKDVAGSTKAFAEYGKDGGINIAKAAVSAGKLGVNMDALTNVTDSLLDFETSINAELELGAMLGKNLNLDRARALAYEGDIGGAVKETLANLGGIDGFNKMDIFQKRKAAELLGISVEQLEKMAKNSDKLNRDGSVQLSKFDSMGETIKALVTGPFGGFLKGLGSGVIAVGQMGAGFSAMGLDVKKIAQKIPLLNKLPGLKPNASNITQPTAAPQSQAGPSDQANKMSKVNANALIKGAVALLILSAALFVAAKAFQEFAEVTWDSVGMGLGALVGLAGVAFLLSKIKGKMIEGAIAVAILGAALIPFAYALNLMSAVNSDGLKAAGIALVAFTAAVFGLGLLMMGPAAIVFGAGILALTALGAALVVFGAGLLMVGNGMSALTGALPSMVEQIAALSTINFLPIFGLAGALMALSVALAAVAVTGLLALPALLALGLVAGGAAGLMGGGSESGESVKMDELINEIKALRGDLLAGKIGVNMDGQKVTSKISTVVAKVGSNSYAKI